MSFLQITLLGNIRITNDNWQSEVKLTRSLQAILAYLLLNRDRTIPREVLADIFWGELSQRRARNSLNTAIWRLRGMLEPRDISRGSYLISNQSGELGINQESDIWLDVAVFEEKVNQVLAIPYHNLKESQIQEIDNILLLYKGDLLVGFYDDWVLMEREHIRNLYIYFLKYLMNYEFQQGLYEKGLSHGQQLLELEPLQEDVHRKMIRFYMKMGQRALAIRQYKICCRLLAENLGLPPMRETQNLYEKIVSCETHKIKPTDENDQTELTLALYLLNQAAEAIDFARRQVKEVVEQSDTSLKKG